MRVGCRSKNWRGSATSNAGTPVSAAGKSRGFKLEERKRSKRMEVSIGHAHFLQTNLPNQGKRERSGMRREVDRKGRRGRREEEVGIRGSSGGGEGRSVVRTEITTQRRGFRREASSEERGGPRAGCWVLGGPEG